MEPNQARRGLAAASIIERDARFFKVFSTASRLELFLCIAVRSGTVAELAGRMNLDGSLLSHHLRRLRTARLVRCRRNGRWHSYEVSPGVEVHHAGEVVQVRLTTPGGTRLVLTPPPGASYAPVPALKPVHSTSAAAGVPPSV